MGYRYVLAIITMLAVATPLLARPALDRAREGSGQEEPLSPEEAAREEAAQDYALALQDYGRTGVDTSIADALSELPILDVYNPGSFASLGEMPRLPFRGYVLVAPGAYQLDGAVFCLHAGAYAPGGGDGYALAPLRGLGARLIHTILYRWLDQPQIPQRHIQLMLWGVVDRVSPDALSEDLTSEVALLLSTEEIEAWRELARAADPPPAPDGLDDAVVRRVADEMGVALPVTPDQLRRRIADLDARRQAASFLPGGVGQILGQIEDLRGQLQRLEAMAGQPGGLFAGVAGSLLQQAGVPYEQIEAAAAPFGDPEPPEDSRQIPRCRWSYEPFGGVFVRTIPLEGYWRALVQVSVPGASAVERDAAGRVSAVVGSQGDRVEISYRGDVSPVGGHDGLSSAQVAELRYLPAVGQPEAWSQEQAVVIGQPDAEGGAKDKAVAARIEAVRAVRGQILSIAKLAIDATARRPTDEPPAWSGSADALDISALIDAFPAIAGYEPQTSPTGDLPTGPEAAALEVLCEAMQGAVRAEVDALAGIQRVDTRVSWAAPDGVRDHLAYAMRDVDDWGPPNPFDPANRRKGPQVPQYDPSASVAQPGNTGRQRLASAARGSEESEESAGQGSGSDVGDSPGSWFGGWLDTLLDVFSAIDDWVSNDPPRDDYRSFDLPATPALPVIERPEGFSDARWQAALALMDALLICDSDGVKTKISIDRMGGAAQAAQEPWVLAQAAAVTHWKRQLGIDLLALADAVDAYREVLVAEGEPDLPVPAMEPDADLVGISRQASELLGLTAEEMEAARSLRAAGREGTGRLQALQDFSASLRADGEVWSSLPEVPMPSSQVPTVVTLRLP